MLTTEKVTAEHLNRKAIVYVRQSTSDQVRFNLESQRRQYGLTDRAAELGWQEVEVIDEDMGRSGSSAANRSGFQKLVASVCLGKVGAVISLEASRLARNNRDWYQLVDVCSLVGALIVDLDGVYDPRLLNDRLLLGMKGTMSEFELGLIRRRALEALQGMAERGELLTMVPVGYVRTSDNRCEKVADLRVQHAIELVFRKFEELGSARQVLLWFRQEKVLFPAVEHARGAQNVAWRLPTYHVILRVLANPTYAGAYAFGRTESHTAVIDSRPVVTRGHRREEKDWQVLIQDHHEGYVSWDVYERNQRVIKENAAMKAPMARGPARGGQSLVSGLLRCRRCGRKLHIKYGGESGNIARYSCVGAHLNQGEGKCLSFGGLTVDRAIEQEIREAVQPAGIEAAIKAAEELTAAHAEREAAMKLALEQARYEAARAHRQYDAVDPDQRLVAAELERRWNSALSRLAEIEADVQQAKPIERPLRPGEREDLLALGEDLPKVWHHPETDIRLKKRIVRTLVEEIVVDVDDERSQIQMTIHWAGGRHSRVEVKKRRIGMHRHATDHQVVDLVRQISKTTPDQNAAAILNRLGYKTGKGNNWTQGRVTSLRTSHGIPAFSAERQRAEGWLNMAQAAQKLGISAMSVRRLLQEGILKGEQIAPYAPWVIHHGALAEDGLKAAVAAIQGGRKRPLPSDLGQGKLNFEAAS